MSKHKFEVIYEQDPIQGFTVTVPSLPGCISEGDTFEEATENITDAIRLYLESLESETKNDLYKQTHNTFIGTISI